MESDDPETLQKLIDFGAAPNLVAVRTSREDKGSGKVSRPGQWQAIWLLNSPVKFKDAEGNRTKSAVLYRAVQKTIAHLTGGDRAFTGRIMRNPFHDDQDYDWQWVHYQKYGLNDLKAACLKSGYHVDRARYLPGHHRSLPTKDAPKQETLLDDQHETRPAEGEQQWVDRIIQEGLDFARNSAVFTALSRRSTSWRLSGKPVQWDDLLHYAEHLNRLLKAHSPKSGLEPQELRGIVQSVYNWGPNRASRRSDWTPPKRGGSWNMRPKAEGLYGGHFSLEQCSKGGVTTWRRHGEQLLKLRLPKARQRSQDVRSERSRTKMARIWRLHCGGSSVRGIIEGTGYPRSTVYALLSRARRELSMRGTRTISLTERSTNETPHNKSANHGSVRPDGGPQKSPENDFDLPEMPLKLSRRRKKAQRLAKMDATEPSSREQSA
ncbi:replication initiation protein [Kocuria sp. CPCC 205235]|uniref:replication initiation protein n=1 Tax=Kocuria sp. CPCC 205235 TaxID=3073549 RepID=UPI0034D5825B